MKNEKQVYLLTIKDSDSECNLISTRYHLFYDKEKCINFMEMDINDCCQSKGLYRREDLQYSDLIKCVCCEFNNSYRGEWSINELKFEDSEQ